MKKNSIKSALIYALLYNKVDPVEIQIYVEALEGAVPHLAEQLKAFPAVSDITTYRFMSNNNRSYSSLFASLNNVAHYGVNDSCMCGLYTDSREADKNIKRAAIYSPILKFSNFPLRVFDSEEELTAFANRGLVTVTDKFSIDDVHILVYCVRNSNAKRFAVYCAHDTELSFTAAVNKFRETFADPDKTQRF